MSALTISLDEVEHLCALGLYLQAYEKSKAFGPLTTWQSVEGRMLFQVAIAWRRLRRSDQASIVHYRAIELPPDHTTCFHSLWLAASELIEGATGAATVRLQGLNAFDDAFYAALHALVSAMAASQARDSQPPPYAEAVRRLRLARADHFAVARSPLLRRFYHLCSWRICADRGMRLTAFWHRLRSWR